MHSDSSPKRKRTFKERSGLVFEEEFKNLKSITEAKNWLLHKYKLCWFWLLWCGLVQFIGFIFRMIALANFDSGGQYGRYGGSQFSAFENTIGTIGAIMTLSLPIFLIIIAVIAFKSSIVYWKMRDTLT